MENNKKRLFISVLVFVLSILTVSFLLPSFKSFAARGKFQALYFYTSRMEADLDGTAGNEVEFVLEFRTNQPFATGGTITIYFPDDQNGEWCRNAGGLTAAGVTSSAADDPGSGSNWSITTALPGTLTASCSQGSSAPNDPDKIVISGITALPTPTNYGVKLSNKSSEGRLGTGDETTDYSPILVELEQGNNLDFGIFRFKLLEKDQVTIIAEVEEIPSVTCAISNNTVDLGTMYPTGPYVTGNHNITIQTANTSGYYWVVYGQGNGSDSGLFHDDTPGTNDYLITSNPGGNTIALTGFGVEGFGLTASSPTPANSGTVVSKFTAGTVGQFGTLGVSGLTGAQLLLYKASNQPDLSTSTITYGARAGASAVPGQYEETVTFVCGGYY